MPYYALVNERHSTVGFETVEQVETIVAKSLETRKWPQGDSGFDGTWDMVEIYDMKVESNGKRKLIKKYFAKDGEIELAGKSASLIHTHAKDDIYKMFGISNVHDRMQDPDKVFVDISVIKNPSTSDDNSFAMKYESNYLAEDGSEDAEEKTISRILDHRMFDTIIEAVSKSFLENQCDGQNVLKVEYGVRGDSFMDEDTYVQGWIFNKKGQLVEQHGYPRKGF